MRFDDETFPVKVATRRDLTDELNRAVEAFNLPPIAELDADACRAYAAALVEFHRVDAPYAAVLAYQLDFLRTRCGVDLGSVDDVLEGERIDRNGHERACRTILDHYFRRRLQAALRWPGAQRDLQALTGHLLALMGI